MICFLQENPLPAVTVVVVSVVVVPVDAVVVVAEAVVVVAVLAVLLADVAAHVSVCLNISTNGIKYRISVSLFRSRGKKNFKKKLLPAYLMKNGK